MYVVGLVVGAQHGGAVAAVQLQPAAPAPAGHGGQVELGRHPLPQWCFQLQLHQGDVFGIHPGQATTAIG